MGSEDPTLHESHSAGTAMVGHIMQSWTRFVELGCFPGLNPVYTPIIVDLTIKGKPRAVHSQQAPFGDAYSK